MDKHIKRILIPIDGSASSKKALELGISIAKAAKAEVFVLEVVEEFGPLPGYYENPPAGKERVKWISDQRLEKVHTILDSSDIKWKRLVEEGYPAEKICEVASKEKIDQIVIGSRGNSAFARFLVGSVSDRVVHHAPCSVTVVR
ncbi:MAG: universal stress protein [Leptospiraceae bacterium]|nr:universal stress protein [Leptospiraceae bacterium]MCK6381511.1 universal stress protein [Leptospiraceae bacterium]NUM41129.1 universal stress protein [Leptospiraceae bacterium]